MQKLNQKSSTDSEENPEKEFSPMQFYAKIISEKFLPADDETNYDIESSAEHLLLKWCSEPPSLLQINDLVRELHNLGFKPTALKKSNNFELVYLLKNKFC